MLCLGSLLAWDDVAVIPCDHPASPFAHSAPPIVVPPIQSLGIEGVKPDLAEEGARSAQQRRPAAAKGGAAEHQHQLSTKGGAHQHQHQPSAKGAATQNQHQPASAKGRAGQHQHQPLSTIGGAPQHHH